jgi:hypothetical protein
MKDASGGETQAAGSKPMQSVVDDEVFQGFRNGRNPEDDNNDA